MCIYNDTRFGTSVDLVVSPSASVSCAPSDLTAIRNWYILIDASIATLRPVKQIVSTFRTSIKYSLTKIAFYAVIFNGTGCKIS